MASITIRNLNEDTKNWLRVRAAENGRSMEQEARLLFSQWQEQDGHNSLPVEEPASEQPVTTVSAAVEISTPDPALVETEAVVANNGHWNDSILAGKKILLIITGGIAAYKSLELIRRLRQRGASIRTIMTKSAGEFITPLAVGALSAEPVFSDLFSREDEHDIGHIRLSREADLIVVAPATANIMAKMANGLADDLASTVLLAADKPILLAPAMNPQMWHHKATRRNVKFLCQNDIHFVGPEAGEMAESGESGTGRMAEPMDIVDQIEALLDHRSKPLAGLSAIVTSGPTREAIDPVRYLSNHSSGKQGHAIAEALTRAGAAVTLVSGPVSIACPAGVDVVRVETAEQMRRAVEQALPVEIAVFVAAVADWRPVNNADEKIKKGKAKTASALELVENPDILKAVGRRRKQRPDLVIGFAAETEAVLAHAMAKLKKKGADWILANDVSAETGVMGGDTNTIRLLSSQDVEEWPTMDKDKVAVRLVNKIIAHFEQQIIEI